MSELRDAMQRSLTFFVQDNYLLEVRGAVQDSLPPSMEESSGNQDSQEGGNARVYYMVHPSVDTEADDSMV